MRYEVILLAGPSGSGKSRLAAMAGCPRLNLDDFYFDADHPGLPHTLGIVALTVGVILGQAVAYQPETRSSSNAQAGTVPADSPPSASTTTSS